MSSKAERLARSQPEVWRVCPVCKRSWRPWAGTKLQSHAKCAFSPELQDEILGLYEAFSCVGLTMQRMADDLEVSISVVRANLKAARERRRNAS